MIRKEVIFALSLLLCAPVAGQKKGAPAARPLPSYRVEAEGFKSAEQDIKAVCDSVAGELWRHLKTSKLEPFVVKRGRNGPKEIHLAIAEYLESLL